MSQDEAQNRRPHPILGPALTVFAALLWAYVVMGTFTTSWMSGIAPLGEGVATLLVALATVTALFRAVRRSRSVPTKGPGGLVLRTVAVGLLAFVLWVLLMIVAIAVGAVSATNVDAFMMAGLLVVAAFAARSGHRLTGAQSPANLRALSFPVVAFWLCVAAVTLAACAEIVRER
jgi:phosphoglycerol transferase MdoB-like AlkP superfamily enzyme